MRNFFSRVFGRPRSDAALSPDTLLKEKYRVERVIGRGGMGLVLAAHHELLDQRVAVKVLVEEAASDPESVARFLREARQAAKLQSTHVVRVVDVDRLDTGQPFLVMEYLDGLDLAQKLESDGPLPFVDAVDYAMQALVGLAHAHSRGIIHRDLKPSNLFLARRANGTKVLKILDFGIAKSLGTSVAAKPVTLTGKGTLVGSPSYMSPEQVRSASQVDPRSDIWAMGVILYELLSGQPPFAGESLGETFAAVLEGPLKPLRDVRPDIPVELERIVERCLERNRDRRFQDVGEMGRALAPLASSEWGKTAAEIDKQLTIPLTDELAEVEEVIPTQVIPPRAANELGPMASTVGQKRFTLRLNTAVRTRAAVAGGALGGLALAALLIGLGAGRGRHGHDLPASPITADPGSVSVAPTAPPEEPLPSSPAPTAAAVPQQAAIVPSASAATTTPAASARPPAKPTAAAPARPVPAKSSQPVPPKTAHSSAPANALPPELQGQQ